MTRNIFIRKIYSVVVYIWSGLLFLNPSVVDYPHSVVPVVLSFGLSMLALILILLSTSEMGVAKILPFKIHLQVNMLLCAALMSAPFVLGYSAVNWLVHFLFGLALLLSTLFVYSKQYLIKKTAGSISRSDDHK